MNNYQQKFIQNLKKYRKEKKLSQAVLAERCGVSTGTIGNIECGIASPSFDLLLKIAEVLEIHPAFLLAEENLWTECRYHYKDDTIHYNKITFTI